MKNKPTYIQYAYDHMMKGNGLSPAFMYHRTGCMRLADVIFRLREKGVDIHTQDCEYGGTRFTRYTIIDSYKLKIQN